ncbi:MAG: class I SAM-dependent methyltransferase [Limisphaerales bacterium]
MSFDWLAPHYRWLEFVLAGDKLHRCRRAWLNEVEECRTVLLVGEGPGRFLETCVHALPAANFVCVDTSSAMLARARAAWQKAGGAAERVKFVHDSVSEWKPTAGYFDLIVTHFFLDCFPEPGLSKVIATLAFAATPSARWLLADFQVPSRGFRRLRARIIIALAYAFFRIATRLPTDRLVSPDVMLELHGFRRQRRREFEWGLLHSDLWARA